MSVLDVPGITVGLLLYVLETDGWCWCAGGGCIEELVLLLLLLSLGSSSIEDIFHGFWDTDGKAKCEYNH